MLFDRWVPTALALAAAAATACGAPGAFDAGHDAARPDVAIDHMLVTDSAADAVGYDDVAPTVDVIAFDAAGGDVAVTHDAYTGADHGSDGTAASMCMALADAYALAVHGAEICSTGADCSGVVCETLCCNCNVYINPASADAAEAMHLSSMWTAAGCAATTACVATPCDPPASAACSSSGRCTTLRSGAGSSG